MAIMRVRHSAPIVLAVIAIPCCCRCQAPEFEVASVRPAQAGAKTQIRRDPAGGFFASSITLKLLITFAYNIQDFQLAGLADGIGAERFDVACKTPAGAKKEQTWVMLQALLADRFKLAAHREERQTTIYAMVVSKNGFKLKESTEAPGEADGSLKFGAGRVTCIKVPTADMALVLAGVTGRRVIDRTGVDGRYDVKLEWAPDGERGTNAEGPSLFTAVEEQLGLKLVAEKGPVEMLVIDHVERPTGN